MKRRERGIHADLHEKLGLSLLDDLGMIRGRAPMLYK